MKQRDERQIIEKRSETNSCPQVSGNWNPHEMNVALFALLYFHVRVTELRNGTETNPSSQVSGNWNPHEMNGFAEGATFESIVHYVLKNMKITKARAGYLVMEVLKAGIALGRIKKTPRGTYILVKDRSGPIAHNIKEPRFSDDSDWSDVSSEESF
ncbi:unnamed protein product [Heterotrigona itama]|uniref:H15 domain-containing protein n=1 Tax=Heterotrigona itama TaxID=395501 RepID=A0A6V7HAH0_9HYME|nr:unnamed protein product [Heterotrigona itama]